MSKQELDRLYERGESANWKYSVATRNDWRLAEKWIGDDPGTRSILDIGCFDGQFLSSLVTEAARFGVEVHEEAASLAESRGINIVGRDFSKLDDLEMRFDVVIATDVIEHVKNPLQFLESMARITSDNGLVIVSTGNVDSFAWRFMGCRYWYCTIGEHLSFLSPEFCRQAAGKLGLVVESVDHFSHYNLAWNVKVSEAVKNGLMKFSPGCWRALRRVGMGRLDCERHPELVDYPPSWKSANDHMIVRFRKRPC